MNCLQFQEHWQHQLDGLPTTEAPAAQRHLASCPRCREWHAAALRFGEGLRLMTSPVPPAGLAQVITASVLADQRRRQNQGRRLVRIAAAVAAGLLLMVFAIDRTLFPPRSQPEPVAQVPETPIPVGTLRANVAEAGDAVTSLGKRTADEAIGHGKRLLDVVVMTPGTDQTMPPLPLDPPVRSLATAGQAIGVGLEPVASSARRAFDLLLRDVPPMDQTPEKPGF